MGSTCANFGVHVWDPLKICWVKKVGAKGPYEPSADFDNSEFQALVNDLQLHHGKLFRDGRFYWLFQNISLIGRTLPKPKRRRRGFDA
jgi:hypothetical protein